MDQVVQGSFRLATNCQVLSPVDVSSDETGVSGQGQMTAGALSSQDVAAIGRTLFWWYRTNDGRGNHATHP